VKKGKPNVVVHNIEEKPSEKDLNKRKKSKISLSKEGESNLALPDVKRTTVERLDTETSVLGGKKYWTENDDSMRLTKTGMNYDIYMAKTS